VVMVLHLDLGFWRKQNYTCNKNRSKPINIFSIAAHLMKKRKAPSSFPTYFFYLKKNLCNIRTEGGNGLLTFNIA
jgi:hypothetical protein